MLVSEDDAKEPMLDLRPRMKFSAPNRAEVGERRAEAVPLPLPRAPSLNRLGAGTRGSKEEGGWL